MQFTSIPFFIFLFIVVTLYYALPNKFRNYLLLIASYYFYFSVQPEYMLILIASTLFNFIVGKKLEAQRKYRNPLLGLGLVFNLGILFFFKYFNFFGEQLNTVFSAFSLGLTIPQHSLILPIGVSFYTFMALGYMLDVYWGDIKSQKNILTFSVYLAFFPQILCGPIGRAKNLFKQFNEEHPLAYNSFANGFRLILWGLFKKMVVADNIGVYVDAVYNNVPMHSTLTLVITALLYPLQLYADFSGYTDIARGLGKLLGFDLMVNFRTPYVNSTSITDYWRRNHISLTSWLRDYVFYPFMGSKSSKAMVYIGISIMFLASGFWHGASWMFLIWGLIQAFYLIVEDISGWDKLWKERPFALQAKKLITYILISLGFLFFRFGSLFDVGQYFQGIMAFKQGFYLNYYLYISNMISGLIILVPIEMMLSKDQFDTWVSHQNTAVRWSLYSILILMISITGILEGGAFIYYQF